MRVSLCAWTHVGVVRQDNEDVVALPGLMLTGRPPVPVMLVADLPVGAIVAVVDGMGGHSGGGTASALVGLSFTAPVEDISAALNRTNAALHAQMRLRPELTSMGATVAGVHFSDESLEVFNVGDARVYRHHDGYTSLLTVDDRGDEPGVITQSLGGTPTPVRVDVHRTPLPVRSAQRYLICSDGLSDVVAFADIQHRLHTLSPEDAVTNLVQAAIDAGAPDNVSVVVVDVHDPDGQSPDSLQSKEGTTRG